MKYNKILWEDLGVSVSFSEFYVDGGASEIHSILEINDNLLAAEEQFKNLSEALKRLKNEAAFRKMKLHWQRFFVSDAANQRGFIAGDRAVSIIEQAPLNGSKAALWAYFIEDVPLAYSHIFTAGLSGKTGDSYQQTQEIFNRYDEILAEAGASLEKNCIRTWIFVRDIDNRYSGMVRARREIFERQGLTKDTHFIASTGIEGRSAEPETLVVMDAYAIPEIESGQIAYLQGRSHLNPTHEYGVTFERGTKIAYGDRSHVIISGTASIDNRGEIMYPLDIEQQTCRMLENVETLLAEAGASFDSLCYLIVYLRDSGDYERTKLYFAKRFPAVPFVILLAPVCRQGWLIEVECSAVIRGGDARFKGF
ncbi:MAG: hypothetical protein LBR64_07050 [Dysgonamonadaceae bacterium]|jgi:enamine deaminase RidA (YjgF/YER057c/UK114 family)|nr:hypothetical protein [Dysgonamonadaceae bacterium]